MKSDLTAGPELKQGKESSHGQKADPGDCQEIVWEITGSGGQFLST